MLSRFPSTVGATALSLLAFVACSDRIVAPDAADPMPVASSVLVGDTSPSGTLTSQLAPTLCVGVSADSRSAGAPLVAATCSGAASQQFRLDSAGKILAYNGALCFDVSGGRSTNGTPVIVWACHGQGNQIWTRTASQIVGTRGKCLATAGASKRLGTALVIATCDGSASQQWSFASDRRVAAPGVPTGVAATAGNAQAVVTWSAPTSGGVPATYTVTAAPGGATTSVAAPALRAAVTGLTNGVAYRFTVVAGNAPGAGPASSASAPVTPTAPAQTTSDWTYCTAAGSMCDFVGLRDVRLGGPSGPYVQQTSFASVPCAAYGFGGQGPAVPPGTPQHCDYGPMKTTVLTNPMPGMAGLGAQVTVPLGDPGNAGPRVQGGAGAPVYVDGTGSFRTTCGFVKYAFDDPIVYPGQPGASHLHVFFGNTTTSAASYPATLVANGNSSCLGGTLNRTAYWAPAVFDAVTQQAQAPALGVFYYKTGYNFDVTTIQAMPAGLRMIAGDKTATGPQPNVYWECRDRYTPPSATIPTSCSVGDAVRLTINFPQCWDGVHLDTPDHKSHMAFAINRNPPQKSTCPADHPVPLIAMAEHVDYPVTVGAHPERWRLVSDMYASTQPGGLSAHADWMNGWDAATMRKFVTYCLNRSMDCGVGGLGDGTTLY